MNADHVRNLTTPIFAPCTRTALGMTEAQPANHLRAQLASLHRIDRRVDGFVGSLQGRGIGMHSRQCASNLLRRVSREESSPLRFAQHLEMNIFQKPKLINIQYWLDTLWGFLILNHQIAFPGA